MNTGNLKSYAPQARRDFIAAVTARANLLGLSEAKDQLVVAEAKISGDLVMIAGRPWPVKVNEQRNKLIVRMQEHGFGYTVEAVAYAWFNRLAALRYMELHDYLGHGRRVLSNRQGGLPEVLAHALDLAESNAMPGLTTDTVRQLKLANQDPELYRLVLIAQCNALHQAMPFLFEQLGDETELLLPENLLLTDSVVAKLVQSIPEEDWQQIEIIGWLYQFFISEKKDQVIGKVVKSEDIPAATQLFTPNWIVKYMVQNTLGAQWQATYPDSPLKAQMEYYVEPAEQSDEVNARLAAITPSALNPEELTLIDPACGSGHILVEAYDLFKAIYLERGYRLRDIPKLILERNLFGLDIDERAAQLTGFALMMKGRADDRQLLDRGVMLNVMGLVDSPGFDTKRLAQGVKLGDYDLKLGDLSGLKQLFEHASTFGSLIEVPNELSEKLPALKRLSKATSHDLFYGDDLKRLDALVRQAELLAARYGTVVMNPPYMGSGGMNATVKEFAKLHFPEAKNDLFACFIERGYTLARDAGSIGMVTMQSWMFLSSFEALRKRMLRQKTISTMAHIGYNSFPSLNSKVAQATAFSFLNCRLDGFLGSFIDLTRAAPSANKQLVFLKVDPGNRFEASARGLENIPGSPIAYWVKEQQQQAFSGPKLADSGATRRGLQTGDKERFIRNWQECDYSKIEARYLSKSEAAESAATWFYFNNGGDFRKWYGNLELVVHWERDGALLKSFEGAIIPSEGLYFRSAICWSRLTWSPIPFRIHPFGVIPGDLSPCFYSDGLDDLALGYMNSPCASFFLNAINPTLTTPVGDVAKIPFIAGGVGQERATTITRILIDAHREDWNAYERSWDFQSLPLLTPCSEPTCTLESSYGVWITKNRESIAEMKGLEEENNRIFIDAYGLQDELTSNVPIEQITLTVNPAYRYGSKLTEGEQWIRFRQDSMAELVSYSIGCMMGRYSLDTPGLLYAGSGNGGFDASRYIRFPADADGILPITEELWFEDDAALRIREFLRAVWGPASLEQNMTWLAEHLGRNVRESPEEAIRCYLADKFFKDHLQTYNKRPIYWLFSSGKQGAFQALVYLHRYNAGTLSRLRAEYVIPLTGKMQSRIELLERDAANASSTAARNRSNKQLESLRKKHLELLAYDEQLRHYADQRIELDLDDGVRVNYGKFGNLLAEVKAIAGKNDDD